MIRNLEAELERVREARAEYLRVARAFATSLPRDFRRILLDGRSLEAKGACGELPDSHPESRHYNRKRR